MSDPHVLANPALTFIIGDMRDVINMPCLQPLPAFSEAALNFLDDLSRVLRAAPLADVASFAFWCRRNAQLHAQNRYVGMRLGKGIAFHNTPSNVPLNFAFSWAAGLLAGNANIVRLPRRSFEQETFICNAIRKLLPLHGDIAPYNVMLRYSSEPVLNDYFSALCDVRIIWGGDQSIKSMRQSPIKPSASELIFPDRYSILVINTDKYLLAKDKDCIARNFYNDTYSLDQNACSSPALIVWIGDKKEHAKEIFWQKANDFITQRYNLNPIQATEKYAAFCTVATHDLSAHIINRHDWLITRIKIDKINEQLMSYRCHSGFFFEYDANSLDDIDQVCGPSCQTVVYYGFSKQDISDFVMRTLPKGICRFVPIGRALDFNLVWDGMDLIEYLSRRIEVY